MCMHKNKTDQSLKMRRPRAVAHHLAIAKTQNKQTEKYSEQELDSWFFKRLHATVFDFRRKMHSFLCVTIWD